MVIMVQRMEKKTRSFNTVWLMAGYKRLGWGRHYCGSGVGGTTKMGPTFHRQPSHQLQPRCVLALREATGGHTSDTGWFPDPAGAPSTVKPLSKWSFVVGSSPVRCVDCLKHASVSNPDLDRFVNNIREK